MLIVCHIYYWMSPLFENQRVLFHITKTSKDIFVFCYCIFLLYPGPFCGSYLSCVLLEADIVSIILICACQSAAV